MLSNHDNLDDNFASLFPEILLEILTHLPLENVPQLATVRKSFSIACADNGFWKTKFIRHFPQRYDKRDEKKPLDWATKFVNAWTTEYKDLSFDARRLFSLVKEESTAELSNFLIMDDLYQKDSNGKTMIDWAKIKKSQALLDVFYQSVLAECTEQGVVHFDKKMTDERTLLHWSIICRQSKTSINELFQQATKQGIYLSTQPDANKVTPLILAVQENYIEAVKILLGRVVTRVNAFLADGTTALHIAIENDNQEIVAELLKVKDINCEKALTDGDTPLTLAAKKGSLTLVKLLLQRHANINAKGSNDKTPLCIAAHHGHAEIVQYLLDNDAQINTAANDGWTALAEAINMEHWAIAKMLIKYNADVNTFIQLKRTTPLHFAILADNVDMEVINLLLKKKADVNARRESGATPFYLAAQNGRIDTLKLLMQYNADINIARTTDGQTPLGIAAKNGHAEIVKLLLEANAEMDLDRQNSPLELAIIKGHLDIVKLLVEKQAKKISRKFINLAVKENQFDIFKYLLETIDYKPDICLPVFCQALNMKQSKFCQHLLKKNFVHTDVFFSLQGYNAMQKAIEQNHCNVLNDLFEKYPEMIYSQKEGTSLLHRAVKSGDENIVEYLLDIEADLNTQQLADGNTPLHLALKKNHVQIAKCLLEKNANVNRRNKNGMTPLHFAIRQEMDDITSVLLAKQPNVNAKTHCKTTALHLACFYGNAELVKILLSRGADINAVAKNNTSALYWAAKKGFKDIVKILLKNNADVNVLRKFQFSSTSNIMKMINEQSLLFYNDQVNLRPDDHYKTTLTLFNTTWHFGCSAAEKKAASAALINVAFNNADKACLKPHRKALDNGELGLIKRSLCP